MHILSNFYKPLSSFVILFFHSLLFACDIFPHIRTLNTMPEKTILSLHQEMAKLVAKNEYSSCNFFTCTFIFRSSKGKNILLPLTKNYIKEKTEKIDEVECNELKKLANLNNKNLIFFSSDYDTKIFSRLQSLHTRFKAIASKTSVPCLKNQAMLLNEFDNRAQDKKGIWRPDVLRAIRTTDSEAKAIYILQHKYIIDNILNDVKSKLSEDETVSAIEFHGCTTRDMCGLCFTNLNIIQFLANNDSSPNFSFLKYMKRKLSTAKSVPSIKTFISSIQPLTYNINFSSTEESDVTDEYLYQFRIPQETAF